MVAAHPKKTKSKGGDKSHVGDTPVATPKEETAAVELGAMDKSCSAIEEALDEETPVLSEKEQHRLHRAQVRRDVSSASHQADLDPLHSFTSRGVRPTIELTPRRPITLSLFGLLSASLLW